MRINDDYAKRFEDLVLKYSRTSEALSEESTKTFDAELSEAQSVQAQAQEQTQVQSKPAGYKYGAPVSEELYSRMAETGRRDMFFADAAYRYSRTAEALRKTDAAFAGTEDIYSRAKSTQGRDTVLMHAAQRYSCTAQDRYDAVLADAAQRSRRAKEIHEPDAVMSAAAEMYSRALDVSGRFDAVLASHRNHYLG